MRTRPDRRVVDIVYLSDSMLAVFSARARRVITEREFVRTVLRVASGNVLIGFGVRVALERETLS